MSHRERGRKAQARHTQGTGKTANNRGGDTSKDTGNDKRRDEDKATHGDREDVKAK